VIFSDQHDGGLVLCVDEMPGEQVSADPVEFRWRALPDSFKPPAKRGSSFGISVLLHGGLIVLLAVVRFTPGLDERWKKYARIGLFAPAVQEVKPVTPAAPAPPRVVLSAPKRFLALPARPAPLLTLPAPPVAEPPRIVTREPVPATRPLPALPAPVAPVRTGVFSESAAAAPTGKTAQPTVSTGAFNAPSSGPAKLVDRSLAPTGAFGPATAVARAAEPVQMARNAGFDGLAASAPASARPAPVAAASGFGGPVAAAQPSTPQRRTVTAGSAFQTPAAAPAPEAAKTAPVGGAFGDAQVAQPGQAAPKRAARVDSDIEIVFKPRPEYTEEGRRRRVEGEVILEVVFGARGDIRVLRVVKGLGAGLDENAIAAARQIRFKPAVEDGVAVDRTATARITFQLAY
jgi:TonB family protein